MIKVLHLRDTDRVCGPGKTIMESAVRIDRARFDVSVGITMVEGEPPNAYAEALRSRDVTVLPITASSRFDPRIVKTLARTLDEHQVHIVHSHDYKTDILGFLATRLHRIPLITTIHGWIINDWKGRVRHGLARRLLPYFDRVVAVSPLIERQLRGIGVPQNKIRLVYNAIVADNYRRSDYVPGALKMQFGIPDAAVTVGNIGRLSPEKGQKVFLDSFVELSRAHDDVYGVIIGEGRDKNTLEQQTRALGLSHRIFFTGYVEDVRPLLRDLDILALSSFTEGLPNVVLEALCMGCSVVATAVGGTPEIVEDGRTGFLVEPGNARALAQRLSAMVGNPSLRSSLTAAGRKHVLDRFEFKARMARMESIYEELQSSISPGRNASRMESTRS